MLLLYTVCVVKQGQSLYNGVLLLFFLKFSTKKGWEKKIIKHNVSGSVSVEKPKPVAFLCCKFNFYFHIHFMVFASIETNNKRNLLKCTIGFHISIFSQSKNAALKHRRLRSQYFFFFFFTLFPLHTCPPVHRVEVTFTAVLRQSHSGLVMWKRVLACCPLDRKHSTHL